MANSVTDPVLGKLELGRHDQWGGKVKLKKFGKGKWPTTLAVQVPDDEIKPDVEAIALLLPLLENAATLTDLILDGLWSELSGHETQNGHWWARPGGIEVVNEKLDEQLTKREDLLRVLKPLSLYVRKDIHGDGKPTAVVAFRCDFEEEHGLDVLTDGTRVLGTGYALDAEKYERYSAITSKERKARRDASLQAVKKRFKKK